MNTKKNATGGLTAPKLLKSLAAGLAIAGLGPLLFTPNQAHAAAPAGGGRKLTVYYTRTNATGNLARMIHEAAGGDILELKLATPYSSDYDTATEETRLEYLTGKRRPNQPITIDISSYDVIFLGSPRWWGTLSIPTLNFVLGHDLTGKTIVPFNTHGGGSREKTFEDLELLLPNSTILKPLSMSSRSVSGAKSDVASWLRGLRLAK